MTVFSNLKMGGICIESALQVGFMLRALLHRCQAVVQEFCLGRNSLTEASLQRVMEQCTNYNKDPWKGPVEKEGKPIPRGTPSANAAGTDSIQVLQLTFWLLEESSQRSEGQVHDLF